MVMVMHPHHVLPSSTMTHKPSLITFLLLSSGKYSTKVQFTRHYKLGGGLGGGLDATNCVGGLMDGG